MVWPFLGVGVEAGGDRDVFLYNRCVWVGNVSEAVDNAPWPFIFFRWVWEACGWVYYWDGYCDWGGYLLESQGGGGIASSMEMGRAEMVRV